MAANMLHSVKHNIKAQYIRCYKVIHSYRKYIFGQLTQKQRCFETFDATKIFKAAFNCSIP